MAITSNEVTAISLAYSNTAAWSVFNASTRASAGNLQANWDYLLSGVSAQYKPLLNSARAEINILEGASGADFIGISGITGVAAGDTVYSAIYSLNTALSAINASAAYAGSAATAAAATTALAAASATYAASAGTAAQATTAVAAAYAASAAVALTAKYA